MRAEKCVLPTALFSSVFLLLLFPRFGQASELFPPSPIRGKKISVTSPLFPCPFFLLLLSPLGLDLRGSLKTMRRFSFSPFPLILWLGCQYPLYGCSLWPFLPPSSPLVSCTPNSQPPRPQPQPHCRGWWGRRGGLTFLCFLLFLPPTHTSRRRRKSGKKDRQSYFLLFLFLFLFPPLFSFSLPPSFFSGGEKTVGGNTKRENFHVKKARPGSVLFLSPPPLFPSQVRRFLSPILSYEYIVQGTMWLALLFRPVSLFPAESRAASFSPRPSSRADFRIGRAKTQIRHREAEDSEVKVGLHNLFSFLPSLPFLLKHLL